MAALSLRNLVKVYPGNVRAVDDLTIEVADGELLVLVGPSGCGKTTSLRMVAGLETITSGTVSIDGRVVNRLRPADRDVAMVFQSCALFPHMTVYKNMAFGLALRKTPRDEIRRRVERAAEVLGIEELLARHPGQLSGGERQRVALGRAIVRQAKVFLLDEPLANLDARLCERMRSEIRRLHERLHTTMIYVTHDQTEAMTVGQRLAVIRQGRIQQAADPDTLYSRPANCFVAQSIGSPAMNLLNGHIRRHDGELVFDEGSFRMTLRERWAAGLEAYCGRPVILGVRPEHLAPAAQGPAGLRLRAEVEAIERLGAESHVQLGTGNSRLVWRVDAGSSPAIGQSVELSAAAGKLHFFDAQTQQAVR